MAAHATRTKAAAIALMLASGFAGLGYQIVWTRQCALWLGQESVAVLAVVAAFFGGLAIGAASLAPRIERSDRPGRWYAACELSIGTWGLALLWWMSPATDLLLQLTGTQPSPLWQWCVAFGGTLLLLLPATAAMGATLPAMQRAIVSFQREGTSLPALYAANTFGAVLGVLVVAFWLVPTVGLGRTAGLCALLNFVCAGVAVWQLSERETASPSMRKAVRGRHALWTLAVTGLLGIGYEVLVVRVLSQVAEDTVYTFAMLLAVYLVGSAIGAAAYARWRGAERNDDAVRDRLLCWVAAACIAGTATLWGADTFKGWVLQQLGAGMGAALAAEAALAVAAFLLPTVAMGALFSHLATAAANQGIGFGRVLAVNTFGASLAPPLFGVLLVPLAGPKPALLLVAAGYLALSSRRSLKRWPAWVAAVAVAALGLMAPPLAFIDVPEGGHVVAYHEGAAAAVSVVEDAEGIRRLRIDNRQQEGTSATRLADGRQALLPLLLHPSPRRVLFLGLGTGMTASVAAEDPALQVDAVELLPEVIEAASQFAPNGSLNPRVHATPADARRFVRASRDRYDVIVSDNFHPARSGSGSLYTVEHFRAVRERLAPGGVFCQWLPLHQLDLLTLRSIVAAFLQANPEGWAMLATNSLQTPVLGLVARADGQRFEATQLHARIANAARSQGPAAFGLPDELSVLGSFIAGPRALRQFASDAPVNTDDRPVVAYIAPRITYAPDSSPADRLLALLRQVDLSPQELIAPDASAQTASRLSAYWQARNRFLDVGRGVRPERDVRRMLAQVREPLLGVLRISPDFRPAYEPLQRMAAALAEVDEAGARALQAQLRERAEAVSPPL